MKRQDDIWISSILIPCDIWQTNKQHESNLHLQVTSISVAFKLSICWTKASGGDNLMRTKTRSSRMNVATDQTIILGLQIFLDHRSSRTLDQKILMHPVLKRQDRLRKDPFAGFGTVVEDIQRSGYTKNQPILLGPF